MSHGEVILLLGSACIIDPMRRIHSVLLVEDDRELHEAMTAILDAEGYRVIGAYDGQQAIDRLREGVRPSVILQEKKRQASSLVLMVDSSTSMLFGDSCTCT